jgi:hypothetical protein
MPVPWLQIVQWVPSILEVSRELMRKTQRARSPDLPDSPDFDAELQTRVLVLEENERRQAELVNQMAEQIAQLTNAVTTLHQLTLRLGWGLAITATLVIVALVIAIAR